MAGSRCSNDAIRNLSQSLGSIFSDLAGRSFYEIKTAPRDLRLPSVLLGSQRKMDFPFPNPAKFPQLSIPDWPQVTSPAMS